MTNTIPVSQLQVGDKILQKQYSHSEEKFVYKYIKIRQIIQEFKGVRVFDLVTGERISLPRTGEIRIQI